MYTAHTAEPYNECVRIVRVPYDNTTSTTCMIDFLVIVKYNNTEKKYEILLLPKKINYICSTTD